VEIGAGLQEITPTLAEGLHLPQPWGVLVDDVKPDGPAAGAGLQIQDIVLSADDRRVETLPSITAALYLHRLDRVLKLEVLRGQERKTIYVPAVEQHDPMDQLLDAVSTERSLIPRLGILAMDFTTDLSAAVGSLRIPSGVLVVGRAAIVSAPGRGRESGGV
jgi:predicted metalloprotease with PDZ domain